MAPDGRRNKKSKKPDKSESSTPQPPVPDEENLLHGACGSSSSRQSRSTVKSTRATQKTVAEEKSPRERLRTTSTRNAPLSEPSPEKNLLAVPDQESGAVSSSSPSKKNIFSQWMSKLSPKKSSPNLSVDPECESKDIYKTECPQFQLEADAKRKSPKRLNEPKASSSVSAILKGNVGNVQSSSGSDPSFKEFSNTPPSEPLEKKLLAVPEQEKNTESSRSPTKNIFDQIKRKISPKKSSPDGSSVGQDCRCVNKNNHELQCGGRGKHEAHAEHKSPKSSSKSSTSSSSASSILKKNQETDVSNPSSKNSKSSSLKSSSASGTNVKLICQDKRSDAMGCSSGNKNLKESKYTPKNLEVHDPLESSKDSEKQAPRKQGSSFDLEFYKQLLMEKFKRLKSGNFSDVGIKHGGKVLIPILEKFEDIGSEDDETENPKASKRSTSHASNIRFRCVELAKNLEGWSNNVTGSVADENRSNPSAERKPLIRQNAIRGVDTEMGGSNSSFGEEVQDGSNVSIQMDAETTSSAQYVQKDRISGQDTGRDVDTQPGSDADRPDPSAKRKDKVIRQDAIRGVDTEMGGSDSSFGEEVQDGSNVSIQMGAGTTPSAQSVQKEKISRRDSGSDVDTQLSAKADRSDPSVRKSRLDVFTQQSAEADQSDPSVRQKDRSNAAIKPRAAAIKSLQESVEGLSLPTGGFTSNSTRPVASVRRHQSLSPYPLHACDCGSSYFHEIGCSREIKARQRRKRRKCRQDTPASTILKSTTDCSERS